MSFNPDHLALSRRAAAEGMVLLKNEKGALPLSPAAPVALFGRTQTETFKGGGGSADLWHIRTISFADGLDQAGNLYQPLLKKYRAFAEANRNRARNKVYPHYTHSLREVPLTDEEIEAAAQACETAVVCISRFSGEHFDIQDIPGEYRLSESETALLSHVCGRFRRTVLVFNLPSLFDLTFLKEYHFDAILQAWMPGMEAGHALADVLFGKVCPCGKLPDSWAETSADYPTNEGFSTKRIVYSEGVYMGYRYFDTFGKDVVYPFGYGLSYTRFEYEIGSVTADGLTVTAEVAVRNAGEMAGRESVQCYLSMPEGLIEKPSQTLCGFGKTGLLSPGESETLAIRIDLTDFSSYCETSAAYLLEAGDYILRIGRHSRDTEKACVLRLDRTLIIRQVENRLIPPEEVALLTKEEKTPECIFGLPVIELDSSKHVPETAPAFRPAEELPEAAPCTFKDVLEGRRTVEELVSRIPDEELTRLLTGDVQSKCEAAGYKSAGELAIGEGSHTHPVPSLGIPASTMQDGPAGVRAAAFTDPVLPDDMINGMDCICFPSAICMASTWDRELMTEIGRAIACDMERYGFMGLCAPGANLHRNPRCGRNFEYFSEDPFLAAQMAAAEICGIQQKADGSPSGLYAVLKHFAFNESEGKRLESDSILTERTARELYLRAFEYVIRQQEPLSIMTAYNLVNGKPASGHPDLLDGILRTEWGYSGWVMTDWGVWGDPAAFIAAGVDTEMPGRYIPVDTWAERGLTRAVVQRRVCSLIRHLVRTKHYSF